MRKPKPNVDEEQRLATLSSFGILDTPPEERFDRYTRLASKVFNAPIVAINFIDRDRVWVKSAIGPSIAAMPRELTICNHAIEYDDLLVVEDIASDARFNSLPAAKAPGNMRFYAGAPLPAPNGHILGAMCVLDKEPRRFSESDRDTFRDIVSMVADELIANVDDLTGLSNRRGLRLMGAGVLAMCQRGAAPATMLMLDLDGFKTVNDRYGHAEGDRALKRFAVLLRDVFRESDVVARIGGDEFCVLLSGASAVDIRNCIRRLHSALENPGDWAASGYQLRFSVGSVEYNSKRHESIHDLMVESDRLMYRRKRLKRRGVAAA